MVVGYTTGVYDLFHVGHLNLLRSARGLCDRLIVGVLTDDVIAKYKQVKPVIPFEQRIEIVRAIKYVDAAIRRDVRDIEREYEKLKFNAVFVGDDWYEDENWSVWESELKKSRVKIVYLPRTPDISTTLLKGKI